MNTGSPETRTATKTGIIPVSVYMITFNNARTIERALASVAGWADEVVVVDSASTDGAIEIIERYTNRLFQFDTKDMREKYQYAQDQCRNDWVIFIDADEWLTDEIKGEIGRIVTGTVSFDGFNVRRRNIYLGREIKHGEWSSDEEIRLYRKDRGGWQGGIHARVHVDGTVGRLKNHYMHTPYVDTTHQIMTIERYSSAYAQDLYNQKRLFRLIDLIARPLFRFFRDYILKLGFLDGVPGLVIVSSTMYYVFMKHAKLWEMERKNGRE